MSYGMVNTTHPQPLAITCAKTSAMAAAANLPQQVRFKTSVLMPWVTGHGLPMEKKSHSHGSILHAWLQLFMQAPSLQRQLLFRRILLHRLVVWPHEYSQPRHGAAECLGLSSSHPPLTSLYCRRHRLQPMHGSGRAARSASGCRGHRDSTAAHHSRALWGCTGGHR